ncbi:MAG: type 4a pilus biogenesis protein PilO [Candidatus Levybacteria bacterium]|nr:type 4a pilus biogenesis protein PilO [Candidatus Levybacteria bacterium]
MQKDSKNMTRTKYFPTLPYLTPERSQKFFGLVLTLLALSFFGFFAIKPTVSTILKLQKELSDNQFVYEQLEIKIRNLSTLRGEYANMQKDLTVVTDAITINPDAHLLFAQIQSIARTSNVNIGKLQNFEVEVVKNDKTSDKQYFSYSFSIIGSGSIDNISAFISNITNMQRVIDLDVFTINNITEQGQSLEFNIQGTAFFKN